jgi:hypothetical protein
MKDYLAEEQGQNKGGLYDAHRFCDDGGRRFDHVCRAVHLRGCTGRAVAERRDKSQCDAGMVVAQCLYAQPLGTPVMPTHKGVLSGI